MLWERWCAGDEQARGLLLEQAAALPPERLVPLLVVEQQRRWEEGDRIRAETFFASYPSLKSRPDLAVDLVYAEFLLESDADGAANAAAYLERFPQLGDGLRRQLDLERGLAAEVPADFVDSVWPMASDAGRTVPQPTRGSPDGAHGPHVFGDYELLEVIAEGGGSA